MNTLKLKVLLTIANKRLWRSFAQSLLVWLTTGIIGALAVCGLTATTPDAYVISLSLLFSSPAIPMAILVLYFIGNIEERYTRIAVAILSVLVTSVILFTMTAILLGVPFDEIAGILFPFVPSGLACLFLIAGKQILKSTYVRTTI